MLPQACGQGITALQNGCLSIISILRHLDLVTVTHLPDKRRVPITCKSGTRHQQSSQHHSYEISKHIHHPKIGAMSPPKAIAPA